MADSATLQQRLDEAENAYHQLQIGRTEVTVSYQQGTGARAVTYSQADRGALAGYIADLKRQLGMSRRRAIGIRF